MTRRQHESAPATRGIGERGRRNLPEADNFGADALEAGCDGVGECGARLAAVSAEHEFVGVEPGCLADRYPKTGCDRLFDRPANPRGAEQRHDYRFRLVV